MVGGGVHRKTRRYRSASTRQHFSRFGTSYKSGSQEAHSIFTHFPRDRSCEVCKQTKITRAPCVRRNGAAIPRADIFGDLITADHKVLNEEGESRNNHRYAVVVQDLATQWVQSYPCKTKTSQETEKSLRNFLEPSEKPKVIYTDNSLEFGKACEELSWNHQTSTPHRSETNGIPERSVRRVKEGTSAVQLQSGLDEKWRADSVECYCYLRNVQNLLAGRTPHERRFGEPLKGPVIPFGTMVEYYPTSARDKSRLHQNGKKVLPGKSLGFAMIAGRIWKGDVLVADIEELEKMDASEIYPRRINAKEVMTPQREGYFIFPIADGTSKILGRVHEFREQDLSGELQGESEGLQPTETKDDAEVRKDFWSIQRDFIHRRHYEPRVQLHVPKEETFRAPLKYIDVIRAT